MDLDNFLAMKEELWGPALLPSQKCSCSRQVDLQPRLPERRILLALL